MKTIKSIITICSAIVLFSVIASAQKDSTIQIQTSGQCGECKEKIEHNLSFEKGVKTVSFDVKTKIVTVVFKPEKTSAQNIRIAITKLGYDADALPADTVAYKKLSKCCQKEGH